MTAEAWANLVRLLEPTRPPLDLHLYVEPARSSRAEILAEFAENPRGLQKVLLVGARGGGKSTELRTIANKLATETALAEIDLDASGITAASISAFDLLYLSALALLKLLPPGDGKPLFEELAEAYAGDKKDSLGRFDDAVQGISAFAKAAASVADAAGAAGGAGTLVAAATSLVGSSVRLLTRQGVVQETSAEGSRLQRAARTISERVERHVGCPPCVVIDGLERMNGEAGARFRDIFEQTRLFADADWTSIVAAPPCTLTATSSAAQLGYSVKKVWGFAHDETDKLIELVRRRAEAAGLPAQSFASAEALQRLAEKAGCLPRDTVLIARDAVRQLRQRGGDVLDMPDVEAGIRKRAEALATGLTSEDLSLLARVKRSGELPSHDRAATLFADGLILAYPPSDGPLTRWEVHPAIAEHIREAES